MELYLYSPYAHSWRGQGLYLLLVGVKLISVADLVRLLQLHVYKQTSTKSVAYRWKWTVGGVRRETKAKISFILHCVYLMTDLEFTE